MRIPVAFLSVFLLFSAVLCFAAPPAAPAEAVKAEEKLDSIKIGSFEVKALPVGSALAQLQKAIKESGIVISQRIPAQYAKKMTISLKDKTLRECLNAVGRFGYTWTASGKMISFIPSDINYQLDNVWISNFILDSCPARTALTELQKRTGKPGVRITARIAPNMERSITLTVKKRKTLRAVLAEFGRFGYIWAQRSGGLEVYPVGKVNEWKTGFGTLKIATQDVRWVNTTRIVNAKFNNAPFAEVEKFLRSKKIAVGSVGRTPVRVTFASGRGTLRQFLTAICLASGFDCEVKGRRVMFRKGAAIGFYQGDGKTWQQLVNRKFPVIRKPISLAEFIQKADPNTAWVLFHAPRINMKNLKFTVTPEISGNTMTDALVRLQKDLHLRVLYASGVVAIFPDHNKARYAFFNRMRSPMDGLSFENAAFAQVLAKIQKQALAADSTQQGTPIVPAVKLTAKKISMDLPKTSSDELLRRMNVALGYYGYISLCGSHYVLVKSGLYNFRGVKITQLDPFVLKKIISGADALDVPLDFKEIAFSNITVENVLRFIKVLNEVRFSNARHIRWAISNQSVLKKTVTFKVEEPTLRSLLEALALRTGLTFETDVRRIYITTRH